MNTRRRLKWVIDRLAVMSLPEILYRLREILAVHVLLRVAMLKPDFFADSKRDAEQLAFTLGNVRFPILEFDRGAIKADASGLVRGQVAYLGESWEWDGTSTCWHLAPDTGKVWPRTLYSRIRYRPGNPFGDVRVAWEVSRLQHLVDQALASEEVADVDRGRVVDGIFDQLDSWVDANPFPLGIHYVSVMECALRIFSVCFLLEFFRAELVDREATYRKCLWLVESHARWTAARISRYSSAGNHTVVECAGLVCAGVLFPEMRGAGKWVSDGLQLLEEEFDRQVLGDGGGIEQSTSYLRFIVDLVGIVVALLRVNHIGQAERLDAACARAAGFLDSVGVIGERPGIGDCDDGHALSRYLSPYAGGRGKIGEQIQRFPESGYVVAGSRESRVLAVFDHGPLGMPPCFGHGHADCLSFLLAYQGRPVLIDTGTYAYSGDAAWRSYLKGTAAHNTVCVNHADQAQQISSFQWKGAFHTDLVFLEEHEDRYARILARHDGYLERFGVMHWRGIVAYSPTQWVIWDFLRGEDRGELDLNWHLPFKLTREDGWFVAAGSAPAVKLRVDGGQSRILSGSDSPRGGWYSPSYKKLEAICTVRTSHSGVLSHVFRTEVVLGDSGEPAPELLETDHDLFQSRVGRG